MRETRLSLLVGFIIGHIVFAVVPLTFIIGPQLDRIESNTGLMMQANFPCREDEALVYSRVDANGLVCVHIEGGILEW